MTVDDSTLDCDVLVIGGGMAGLSAAGYAAQRGARVVLLEKALAIGGSAALSGGYVWTANSLDRFQLYARGRPDLAEVVLRNYRAGMRWIRTLDVAIGPAVRVLHGRGYQVDLPAYFASCANLIEQHEGHVVLGTTVDSLLVKETGSVLGARTADANGQVDVRARYTVLATGGFQNSPELRARYIHQHARDRILLRSNPYSDGAGMRLATTVGAATSLSNPGFYGHLVSESPQWGRPGLYVSLAQYHSEHAVLLNEQGERFCDESLGDHVNTGAVLGQSTARALCVWDSRVHQAHVCVPLVKGTEAIDKMSVALDHGGNGIVAADWTQLESFADRHGFNGRQAIHTLREYNHACRECWEALRPERSENFGALDQPPYFALVVVPAITHTHAGIRIDRASRVLRGDGSEIEGLLAAGADAGDAYGVGYAGGLGLALALGLQAAQTATGDHS